RRTRAGRRAGPSPAAATTPAGRSPAGADRAGPRAAAAAGRTGRAAGRAGPAAGLRSDPDPSPAARTAGRRGSRPAAAAGRTVAAQPPRPHPRGGIARTTAAARRAAGRAAGPARAAALAASWSPPHLPVLRARRRRAALQTLRGSQGPGVLARIVHHRDGHRTASPGIVGRRAPERHARPLPLVAGAPD